MYYFEPTSSFMTEFAVKSNLGSVVLDYSNERQNSMGLFRAITDYGTVYNQYTHTLSGFEWVKFSNSEDLENQFPEIYDRISKTQDIIFDNPFYLQMWNIVALDGDAAAAGTAEAKRVVSAYAAEKLASLSGYANQNGCPNTITDYISQILGLTVSPAYPYQLAQAVTDGTYTGWPEYPDVSLALDSIASAPAPTTNADIAFNRIINSYSVPGSYPNKVAAITAAIGQFTEHGSVSDLYEFAVNYLNAL